MHFRGIGYNYAELDKFFVLGFVKDTINSGYYDAYVVIKHESGKEKLYFSYKNSAGGYSYVLMRDQNFDDNSLKDRWFHLQLSIKKDSAGRNILAHGIFVPSENEAENTMGSNLLNDSDSNRLL